MKHIALRPAWKTVEKWLIRLILILWLPALVGFLYLAVLDSRSANSYNSINDSSNRILQGMMCPMLMVKDKPAYIDVMLHNTIPDTQPTVTVTIDAPNFRFVREETTVIEEDLSPNWFVSPGWTVIPNGTGNHLITVSANADNGLSNAITCEVKVIFFFGLDLGRMYDITMVIIVSGISIGVHSLVEKRKQSSVSKEEVG